MREQVLGVGLAREAQLRQPVGQHDVEYARLIAGQRMRKEFGEQAVIARHFRDFGADARVCQA